MQHTRLLGHSVCLYSCAFFHAQHTKKQLSRMIGHSSLCARGSFQVFWDVIVSFSIRFRGRLKMWEMGPSSLNIWVMMAAVAEAASILVDEPQSTMAQKCFLIHHSPGARA